MLSGQIGSLLTVRVSVNVSFHIAVAITLANSNPFLIPISLVGNLVKTIASLCVPTHIDSN